MSWQAKAAKEAGEIVSYDKKTSQLFYGKDSVATMYEKDGRLYISLDMNSNFQFDSGETACGWKCEEHVGCIVDLGKGSGGIIRYKKNRNGYFGKDNFPEVEIRVEHIEGVIIPSIATLLKLPKIRFWKKVS
jgi:hypothetical protein